MWQITNGRCVQKQKMRAVSSKTANDQTKKETKEETRKGVWLRECEEGRERGNETLMESDRRECCWETLRQDANMMSSSLC